MVKSIITLEFMSGDEATSTRLCSSWERTLFLSELRDRRPPADTLRKSVAEALQGDTGGGERGFVYIKVRKLHLSSGLQGSYVQ